jgi:hypothetical protein
MTVRMPLRAAWWSCIAKPASLAYEPSLRAAGLFFVLTAIDSMTAPRSRAARRLQHTVQIIELEAQSSFHHARQSEELEGRLCRVLRRFLLTV